MTKSSPIAIQNIYYMLSYAFQMIRESNYESINPEDFENIYDLFGEILSRGMTKQLKQGLYKEYISIEDNLYMLKGKLDINNTIKNVIAKKPMLAVEYDDLSENNLYNQIIKLSIDTLIRAEALNSEIRNQLKKCRLFLTVIDEINPSNIRWESLKFHRNNLNYRIMLNVCYFIIDGLLISNQKGEYKIQNYLDDQKMSALFEKFVLEFYRYHYPHLNPHSGQINWSIETDSMIQFLPMMKTDIMLENNDKTHIIDTKFYSKTMQKHGSYDTLKYHSSNLYQIYTYVKNYDSKHDGKVLGTLLYAKTDEIITPNAVYNMDGNQISVKTLDLNTKFSLIKEYLDSLAKF